MIGLEAIDISVEYQRGRSSRPAVRNATLSIPSGQIAFLTGRNGTGKSSLLKAIAGIERYKGEIRWRDTGNRQRLALTRWLPQDIERRCPSYVTVRELLLATSSRGADVEERLSRPTFDELRKEPGLFDRLLIQLSGGQRQLVMWGAGMLDSSRIFLLDETFRSFDLRIRDHLWMDLESLVAAHGGVALVVSHDSCFMAEKKRPIWVFSSSGQLSLLPSDASSVDDIKAAMT